MDIGFLLRGFLMGLSIAAVVGPMSILCMRRTLERGYLIGLVSGLGIATADGTYGSIAAFSLTVISSFLLSEQMWIRLIGGLFLLYLGVKAIFTKPAERAAETGKKTTTLVGAYISTLLLTLANPPTILSFVAVFAGLGVGAGVARNNVQAASLVVLGVFLGSSFWWVFLTGAVSLLRSRITPLWLLWINRISGVIIAGFGIVALINIRF